MQHFKAEYTECYYSLAFIFICLVKKKVLVKRYMQKCV